MKKLVLTVAAVFAFGFANAQEKNESSEGFSKGDVFVSGMFNVGSTKFGDAKTSSFNFSPKVGYFVTENIALGLDLGFGTSEDEDKNKTDEFSVGAFGRYYFTPSSKFSVFGQLGVDVTSSKYTPDGGDSAKSNGFGIALKPGVSYFLSDSFAIEATWGELGFNSDKADGADEAATSFNLGLNLESIGFGLLYKF